MVFPPLLNSIKDACAYRVTSTPLNYAAAESTKPTLTISPAASQDSLGASQSSRLRLVEKRFGALGKQMRTPDVFEAIARSRKGKERAVGDVWFDGETMSVNHVKSARNTTSSLAAPSLVITYCLATRTVTLHTPADPPAKLTLPDGDTFWDWFAAGQSALSARLVDCGSSASTGGWMGGWAGWFGYEMKEESLQGYKRFPRDTKKDEKEDVDACWSWVDRILDRTDMEWVARGILRGEDCNGHASQKESLDRAESMIQWLDQLRIPIGVTSEDFIVYVTEIQAHLGMEYSASTQPDPCFPTFHPSCNESVYRHRIDACRNSIRRGDAYELTLTTSFTAALPVGTDPFALFLRLRAFNPAHFSTYMSFPCIGMNVLSSSPERFLRIYGHGQVEMMPIKGTQARVKVGQCVCVPGRGCEAASPGSKECVDEGKLEDVRRGEALQADAKERAENLMVRRQPRIPGEPH